MEHTFKKINNPPPPPLEQNNNKKYKGLLSEVKIGHLPDKRHPPGMKGGPHENGKWA